MYAKKSEWLIQIAMLFSRFDDRDFHGICSIMLSRQLSIFSLHGRQVAIVSSRMGLQGTKAYAKWKITRCLGRNWSVVHFPDLRSSLEISIQFTVDFAWSFVREDEPRCPDRRIVIEDSFQGVRLETLKLSLPFILPPRRWKGFSSSSFVFIHFYLSASGCQLFFTYIHISVHIRESLYAREDIRVLATYLS